MHPDVLAGGVVVAIDHGQPDQNIAGDLQVALGSIPFAAAVRAHVPKIGCDARGIGAIAGVERQMRSSGQVHRIGDIDDGRQARIGHPVPLESMNEEIRNRSGFDHEADLAVAIERPAAPIDAGDQHRIIDDHPLVVDDLEAMVRGGEARLEIGELVALCQIAQILHNLRVLTAIPRVVPGTVKQHLDQDATTGHLQQVGNQTVVIEQRRFAVELLHQNPRASASHHAPQHLQGILRRKDGGYACPGGRRWLVPIVLLPSWTGCQLKGFTEFRTDHV